MTVLAFLAVLSELLYQRDQPFTDDDVGALSLPLIPFLSYRVGHDDTRRFGSALRLGTFKHWLRPAASGPATAAGRSRRLRKTDGA